MADDQEQPAKRRKVAESCKVCRAKKTRCDGLRPVCSPCKGKNVVCEYNDVSIPVPAQSFAEFEARLLRLEQRGAGGHSRRSPFDGGSLSAATRQLSQAPASTPAYSTLEINPRFAQGQSPYMPHPGLSATSTQASPDDLKFPHDMMGTDTNYVSLTTLHPQSMAVPERSTADSLLSYFEQYVYPMFPILHMPTFRRTYGYLWLAREQCPPQSLAATVVFHATLNVMFAMASLEVPDTEARSKLRMADVFYRRAVDLLPLDTLDQLNLSVVQYLLLMTRYLSFTRHSGRCFNTLTVAIRVAKTLGLHRDLETTLRDQIEVQMSRRVWHHCQIMESLFFNFRDPKTPTGPDQRVPLPQMVDDEYLQPDGTGSQPVGVPSLLEAFIVSCNIFETTRGTWRVGQTASMDQLLRLSELIEVLQLKEKIDQIEKSLSSHLRLYSNLPDKLPAYQVPDTPRGEAIESQAVAVQIRLEHARLVAFRPTVLAAARYSSMRPRPNQVASRTEVTLWNEVASAAVESAVGVISILMANMHLADHTLSANIVHAVLLASTIIIAASLIPEQDINIEDRLPDAEREKSSHGAAAVESLRVLEEYQWQAEDAARAAAQLKKFYDSVVLLKRRGDVETPPVKPSPTESMSSPVWQTDTEMNSGLGDPLWNLVWNDPMMLTLPGSGSDYFPMAQPVSFL